MMYRTKFIGDNALRGLTDRTIFWAYDPSFGAFSKKASQLMLRLTTTFQFLSIAIVVLVFIGNQPLAYGGSPAEIGAGASKSDAKTNEDSDTDLVPDPAEGYRLLTEKSYLPPHFLQADVDQVWQAWPKDLRTRAEAATADQRRRMIFERYGFTERLDYETGQPDGSGKPLQYVVDDDGQWSMNCFACHGGTVQGKSFPGAPNQRFAFELFAKEIRESKIKRGKLPSSFDLGSMLMPLGRTRGTTNAVMFGVGLMHYRDEELRLLKGKLPPRFTHHDMDAPPWWHFSQKPALYIDGFAEKGHRGLMQFLMVEENSSEDLKGWSDDFRHVAAYLESLTPPQSPLDVNLELAKQGATLFDDNCAQCHGTYRTPASPSNEPYYPNRRVPLDEIGTDPVRLRALKPEQRAKYARSWYTHYGEQNTEVNPDGYVAPPLDGVWASGPYFHNGSVPTLWGVLNEAERPTIWQHEIEVDGKLDESFDRREVGLSHSVLKTTERSQSTEVFDTRQFGKSNQGHSFPESLSSKEKLAVFEYLKTL